MKIFTISRQSGRALLANKGRSLLTILGIVIGIGSVIALMALGSGVKQYITGQISTLGSTTLTVMPGADFAQATSSASSSSSKSGSGLAGRGGGGGSFGESVSSLTADDLKTLQDKTKNPDVALAAGLVNGSGVYSDQRFSVIGSSPVLFQIRTRTIDKGSFFTDQDVTDKNKVVDLGHDIASQLFGTDDPIGKTVQIGNDNYKVIGVNAATTETSIQNPNTLVYAPYTAVMDTLGTDRFSNISATATSENTVNQAKTEIENTLLTGHNIKDLKLADFSVSTPADLLSTVGSITGVLTSLLSGIAAISLLVGGIGIMNIMLVSVTERTREIGLRKAVGAKSSDIVVQFLIESIILTLTGGVLGIVVGYLLATIAGHYIGFPPIITTNAIGLAVGISAFIGLVFGVYPAIRASRLNPIDALRYE
jgi:putative ABC transport system permease protein